MGFLCDVPTVLLFFGASAVAVVRACLGRLSGRRRLSGIARKDMRGSIIVVAGRFMPWCWVFLRS